MIYFFCHQVLVVAMVVEVDTKITDNSHKEVRKNIEIES